MNGQLQAFARYTLKKGLARLGEGSQLLFKRMYARGNLDLDINTVVDRMDSERLNWAMDQVERTLDKMEKS